MVQKDGKAASLRLNQVGQADRMLIVDLNPTQDHRFPSQMHLDYTEVRHHHSSFLPVIELELQHGCWI